MSACPVCLNTDSDYKENIVWLECLHPLCTVCLRKLKHKICPLCRYEISNQILDTYITPKKIPSNYRVLKIKTRRKTKYGIVTVEYNEVENIHLVLRPKRNKRERKKKGRWAKMSGKTRANRFNKYR